jgi:hypothetical protein
MCRYVWLNVIFIIDCLEIENAMKTMDTFIILDHLPFHRHLLLPFVCAKYLFSTHFPVYFVLTASEDNPDTVRDIQDDGLWDVKERCRQHIDRTDHRKAPVDKNNQVDPESIEDIHVDVIDVH